MRVLVEKKEKQQGDWIKAVFLLCLQTGLLASGGVPPAIAAPRPNKPASPTMPVLPTKSSTQPIPQAVQEAMKSVLPVSIAGGSDR